MHVIKARSLTAMGQTSAAVSLLASLPDLEQGDAAAELLIHLYLQEEKTSAAVELASLIFARNSKNFAPLRQVSAKLLEGQEPETCLPLLDLLRTAMKEKGEHEALGQLLTSATERLPDRVEPHDWLVDLYKHTSDSFRLQDALVNLARICEACGQQERALQIYEEILDRDPEKESARREYEALKAKSPKAKPKEEPSLPKAPTPLAEQVPPAEVPAAPVKAARASR